VAHREILGPQCAGFREGAFDGGDEEGKKNEGSEKGRPPACEFHCPEPLREAPIPKNREKEGGLLGGEGAARKGLPLLGAS